MTDTDNLSNQLGVKYLIQVAKVSYVHSVDGIWQAVWYLADTIH